MNVKGFVIVLIVILKVVSVKSVCDDYLTCLGSFFSEYFNEKDKLPPLDSVVAKNSESDNVDVNTKELDDILHDVSGFLKEELELHPSMDLNSMLFRQIHNQTAIYVKTFDFGDDYPDISGLFEIEDTYTKPNDQITEKPNTVNPVVANLNTSSNGYIYNNTYEEIFNVTPIVTSEGNGFTQSVGSVVKSSGSGFTQSVVTTESQKLNIKKKERKNEINTIDDSDLYYDNDDNATDYPILDYIEFYKDTTNEYVNLEPTVEPEINNDTSDRNSPLPDKIINSSLENETKGYASNTVEELSLSIFPWVAAIFVKNSTSDQFNYYCDGALLSHTAVVTAASCVQSNNSTVSTDDLLVLFGKTSLKTVGDKETVARIKSIKVHEDFSGRNQGHDLAILATEEPVTFGDTVQAASLGRELGEEQLATTGWATTGELTPILLETKDKIACGDEASSEDTVCAVYGNDITVCPSYGGLYVTKQDTWHLQGIRTGDPEDRGLCFNRNIAFTSLYAHWDWIKLHMK